MYFGRHETSMFDCLTGALYYYAPCLVYRSFQKSRNYESDVDVNGIAEHPGESGD